MVTVVVEAGSVVVEQAVVVKMAAERRVSVLVRGTVFVGKT